MSNTRSTINRPEFEVPVFGLANASKSAPWAPVFGLANASNSSFHAVLTPISLMVRLSYTATYGAYFKPEEQNETVMGWDRPMTLDPRVGMRALLFVQTNTSRGVVVFRGTDLDMSGASGQCDACADRLLWQPTQKLPPFCDAFSNSTIDYWVHAVAFARSVRLAYPGLDLLFSGHSLGAGLALAVAAMTPPAHDRAASISPAVTFASPDWKHMLQRRAPHVPLPSPASARTRFFATADEYDPVQRASVEGGGLIGSQCLWSSPMPPGCGPCFDRPVNLSRPACVLCFEARHIYAHYVYVDVPGPRALCKALPVVGRGSPSLENVFAPLLWPRLER